MLRLLHLPLFVALSVLASGCETVGAAKVFLAERNRQSEELQLKLARVNCEKYGFTKETDAFAGCIQTEINQAKLRSAAAAAVAPQPQLQSTTAAPPPLFPPSPAPTTTSCRRTVLGTMECTSR